jgi:hypothetical protein
MLSLFFWNKKKTCPRGPGFSKQNRIQNFCLSNCTTEWSGGILETGVGAGLVPEKWTGLRFSMNKYKGAGSFSFRYPN